MPSGYLHARCARLASEACGVFPTNADVMTLGAQGPDPLFTLGIFPLRPASASAVPDPLGGMLHQRRTGAYLCALLRRARAGSTIQRNWALGALTHYALDSTVHPYVYAHSYTPEGKYSSRLHLMLEKQWDGLYARRDGFSGTPVVMPGVEETRAHWTEIIALWQGAIGDAFPEEGDTADRLRAALEYSARADRLTHSPRGIKYACLWLLERVIGQPKLITSQMTPRFPTKEDIENRSHTPWHNPADPEIARTEGLEELYAAAVARAATLLEAARAYFDGALAEGALAEVVGNLGYDTGMESKP